MLTPDERREYEALSAEFDRPALEDRAGAGLFNMATGVPNMLMGGWTGLLNTVLDKPLPKVELPPIYPIPPPQNYAEMGADIVPHALTAMATMAVPQVAVTNVLRAAGAGSTIASMAGMGAAGSLYGANFSSTSAGIQGGVGALQGAAMSLPPIARTPLAIGAGIATGADIYNQSGGNLPVAVGGGIADALMMYLGGQRGGPGVGSGAGPAWAPMSNPPPRAWRPWNANQPGVGTPQSTMPVAMLQRYGGQTVYGQPPGPAGPVPGTAPMGPGPGPIPATPPPPPVGSGVPPVYSNAINADEIIPPQFGRWGGVRRMQPGAGTTIEEVQPQLYDRQIGRGSMEPINADEVIPPQFGRFGGARRMSPGAGTMIEEVQPQLYDRQLYGPQLGQGTPVATFQPQDGVDIVPPQFGKFFPRAYKNPEQRIELLRKRGVSHADALAMVRGQKTPEQVINEQFEYDLESGRADEMGEDEFHDTAKITLADYKHILETGTAADAPVPNPEDYVQPPVEGNMRGYRSANPIPPRQKINEPPPISQLEGGRAIIPHEGAAPGPLPYDRQLYRLALGAEQQAVPFTLKDGVIVPTWQAKRLLPEPSAAQVAASIAEPDLSLENVHVGTIRPAIKIRGETRIGEKFQTHQDILDEHMFYNPDDVETLVNFDTKANPNFFRSGELDISRADLKKRFGVSHSQQLHELQREDHRALMEQLARARTPEYTGTQQALATLQPQTPTPAVVPPVQTQQQALSQVTNLLPAAKPKAQPIAPTARQSQVLPPQTAPAVKNPTLTDLKKLAKQMGVTVEDDKTNTNLYVHAPEGSGWDEGTLTSLVHGYGQGSSTKPAWRKAAIKEAYDRLREMGSPISAPVPEKLLKDMTAKERFVARMAKGKAFDLERFITNNNLRVVPEKGSAGSTVFETVRDVAPKLGKLKFEVPPGTSQAAANKIYKTKKAELLATLQQELPSKGTVPFRDVKSMEITRAWIESKGIDVHNLDMVEPGTGLQKLKKDRGERGGTLQDMLVNVVLPGVMISSGATLGGMLKPDDFVNGLVQGAMYGGLLSTLGIGAVRFILSPSTKGWSRGFGEIAQQAARGQGTAMATAFRFLEKNFGSNKTVQRALNKAQGQAYIASQAWNQSLNYLSRKIKDYPQPIQDQIHDYATSPTWWANRVFAALQSQISDPKMLAAMMLERHTRMNAQVLTLAGLDPKSKIYSIIRDSLGMYQKTVYEIFTNPRYKPKQQYIDDTIAELYQVSPHMTWDDARATVEQHLHEIYINRGMAKMAQKFASSSKAENLGDIIRRKNPQLATRPAYRAMMGEITDPLQVRAATALKLIAGIRSGQFFSEIAKSKTELGNNFVLSADNWNAELGNLRMRIRTMLGQNPNAPVATLQAQLRELENYIIVPDSPSLGSMAGMRVHRMVHDHLPNHEGIFEGNGGPLISGLISFGNHVKQSKVGANPLSWVRAAAGVPFFMALSRAGGPMNWIAAAREMVRKGPLWREAAEMGVLSAGYGTGEMKRDLGIILDPTITETVVQKLWNKWTGMGAKTMDWVDQVVRMASYMNNKAIFKAKYPTLTESELRDMTIDWVDRYTMNYSTIPKGVRVLRQMPFMNNYLSYAYEISRIGKNLIEDIATNRNNNRWYAMIAVAGVIGSFEVFKMIMENRLTDKEKEEWEKFKNLQPAYKRYGYLIPTKPKGDGTWDYFNLSPLFVADDIMRMLKSIVAGDWQAVMSNNPVAGWDNTPAFNVAAAVYGHDLRTDMPIGTYDDRFDAIRKEILPPLFGGYEVDNIYNSLRRNDEGGRGVYNQKTGQRYDFPWLVASYATGVRRTTGDLSFLEQREIDKADRQKREIDINVNKKLNLNIPEDEQLRLLERADQQKQRIDEELDKRLNLDK